MSDFLQKSLEASRAAQIIERLRRDLLNSNSQEDCLRIIRSAEELKGYYSSTYASSFDGVVAATHKRMAEIVANANSMKEEAQKRTESRGKRKRGKKHNLTGREKGSVASLIREIRGGKLKQGEEPPTDKEVVEKLKERAKTHSLLKGRIMPCQRALEGWVAIVRTGGTIPGAHR